MSDFELERDLAIVSEDPLAALANATDLASATSMISPCEQDTGLGWNAVMAFVDATAAHNVLITHQPQETVGHVMGMTEEANLPGHVLPTTKRVTGVCFQPLGKGQQPGS